MSQDEITERQRQVAGVVVPRTRRDFRRIARWYELEAMRGYPSHMKCLEYAANMRWIVELMDSGVAVVGRRFDELLKERAAERIFRRSPR